MASRRTAQREMTRRLLLDAAMERFVASGYAATTIDEIASAAGTTRVTFYAYFPSKSEIVKALIAERLDGELARAPEGCTTALALIDAVAHGTREHLGAWIRDVAAHWPTVQPIIKICRAAQAIDPDLCAGIDTWIEQAIDDISAGLAKAGRFEAESRHFRGALAMGQFDYVFQRWTDGMWGVDQERMCELLTHSWFQLLGE
ncbi:TetR/AcrR family transcriptional regulator [Nocardioides sp. NPDC051685]|uniref:TetR/AcrR family transcriptional regulator n=1 Tax=Nocardioides sp. NPDC051685 TaxID=3364334 RepID=UPI0037B328A1